MPLGAHVPFKEEAIRLLYDNGFRAFQFFIGSPQKASSQASLVEIYKNELEKISNSIPVKDCIFIAHSPYWYNFVKGNHLTVSTLEHLKIQLLIAKSVGVKFYVSHVGARHSQAEADTGTTRSVEEALLNLTQCANYINDKLSIYGVKFLFENTPGSKKSTYMGSLSQLTCLKERVKEIQLKAGQQKSWVGYCIDSQHAWANGDTPTDEDFNGADVIHLNGNPFDNEKGSHLDRHSSTLISESYGIEPSYLTRVISMSYEKPLILERDNADVLISDSKYIFESLSTLKSMS